MLRRSGSMAAARFIPTSVGNGSRSRSSTQARSVHPHERGERIALKARPVSNSGSSPRAWGTEVGRQHVLHSRRFIPTSVGNGTNRSPGTLKRSVHPHERGERAALPLVWPVTNGSSPRAWGTDADGQLHAHAQRFIPTSVGNGRGHQVVQVVCVKFSKISTA